MRIFYGGLVVLVFEWFCHPIVWAHSPTPIPTRTLTSTSSSTPSLAAVSAPYLHSIYEKLDGPQSVYTPYILGLIRGSISQEWNLALNRENAVELQCIETPNNPFYIGLKQNLIIYSSLSAVEAVLDDVGHYKDLFPDFEDVHVAAKDGNKWVVSWEQKIPVFFIPNIKYEVFYLVDKSLPGRRVYRYQFKGGDNLKYNDGVIVIENDPRGTSVSPMTRYTEYDFYDADWGILKTVAPGKIWKRSVGDIFLSDIAIKLKAENPDWSYEKIKEESEKSLGRFPLERVIGKKTLFNSGKG